MITSELVNELYAAVAAAQAEIGAAPKVGVNPHFRSSYATLEAVIEAIKGPMGKNGLAIIQSPEMGEQTMVLTTKLVHKSGQWLETKYPMSAVQNTAQAWGSSISYAKRYTIMALLNVPSSDDDGNAATFKQPPQEAPKPKAPAPLAPLKRAEPPRMAPLNSQPAQTTRKPLGGTRPAQQPPSYSPPPHDDTDSIPF